MDADGGTSCRETTRTTPARRRRLPHSRLQPLGVPNATAAFVMGGAASRVRRSRETSCGAATPGALLDAAFVFERRIDGSTYESRRDEIREEIALARLALDDARIEEIDVEGLLRFAESIMERASALWTGTDADQRLRLQSVLFPQGLRLRDGRFGTAISCLAFAQLGENSEVGSGLASPIYASWNLIRTLLTGLDALRRAA